MPSKKEFIIFFVSLLIIALLTKFHGLENDYSRLATVESIIERNTFVLDNSSIMPNVDKVYINGNFYSDKPPMLSILASGVYFIMKNLFNISFSSQPKLAYYLITLLFIGVLSSLTIVFFYKSLKYIKIDEKYKLILSFTLLLATLILPYSLVFNNHIVAASLLFISFYFLLKLKFEKEEAKYFLISGLCASLASTIDLVSGGIFLIIFTIYLLRLKNKLKYLFFLGVVLPITLHLIINISITGDIIPANLHPEYFDYPGSQFNEENLSGFINHQSIKDMFVYGFNMLLGKDGIFLYNPLLLLSLLIIFNIINKKHIFWKEAVSITLGTVIILGYYIIFSNNYGGRAYGIRWFITFIPLLFYFCSFIFTKKFRRYIPFFYILLPISLVFSLFGVIDPWEKLSTIIKIKKIQLEYFLRNISKK